MLCVECSGGTLALQSCHRQASFASGWRCIAREATQYYYFGDGATRCNTMQQLLRWSGVLRGVNYSLAMACESFVSIEAPPMQRNKRDLPHSRPPAMGENKWRWVDVWPVGWEGYSMGETRCDSARLPTVARKDSCEMGFYGGLANATAPGWRRRSLCRRGRRGAGRRGPAPSARWRSSRGWPARRTQTAGSPPAGRRCGPGRSRFG